MINLNQVQKQKPRTAKMEFNFNSNDLIDEIISIIQANPNPQEMLRDIATRLGRYFPTDVCVIIAENQSFLIPEIGVWNRDNLSTETIKQLLLNLSPKTLIPPDQLIALPEIPYNYNPQFSQINQLAKLLSIRALLGIETQFGGNPNGLILLGTYQPHDWTEPEQNLLKRCRQIVAIANSMVHPKEERPEKDLNPGLPFGITRSIPGDNLVKKWYQLTRQQLEQQRQLNELKDEIITVISHEAGTPLATMKLAIEMLQERQDQLSPDSQKRYWGILKQEWQRLQDLIGSIKTLQQLKSSELSVNPQQVELYPICHELIEKLQPQWQEDKRKKLTLVTEGLFSSESDSSLTLYTDPQYLRSILLELLTNAGKFAAPGTNVFLSVTEQQQGNQKI